MNLVDHLPSVNAFLNGTSACLLAGGYWNIRRGDIPWHRRFMVSAFTTSTVFLICYLTYHALRGVVRYHGHGMIRTFYFTLLTSHTILAVVILPLVLRTIYLAASGRFTEHQRIARWTLPLWFYVSVTGVIVYEMLY